MARAEHSRNGRKPVVKRRNRAAAPAMSRVERRAAVSHRRAVVGFVGSIALAAVVLVAWFPASALLGQHRTLASADATLHQLKTEDKALSVESKNLSTSGEIARIARAQFQLVGPGEQAYQVLPPAGTGGGAATDPYSGDPGLSAPVSPSAAAELPPGSLSSVSTSAKPTSHAHPASSPDLISRLLHTLEFWR